MILYALVLDGIVWGFGDTEKRAAEDAVVQAWKALGEGDLSVLSETRVRPEYRVIDGAMAKRVADGERRWAVLTGEGPNPPALP